ncbi:MAG: hypothetical protein FWD48_07045 [Oscillospiraceae bacterium]|nr:hypothetical protein [Oscillospiraceae bacterium]
MKLKKVLGILLAVAMFGALAVSASAYTATIMGQMDTDVSDEIGEWDLENWAGASTSFEFGKPFTIKISFADFVAFSGNWTGISTNVPVNGDEEAAAIPVEISIKADGTTLSQSGLDLIDRDSSGFLTIDLARQWGGSYDHFGLAGRQFKELEITVTVGVSAVAISGDAPVARADGGDVKTGVADVAVASAIALMAAGAVVISRKKR